MRKIIALVGICYVLSSCSSTGNLPLRGTYLDKPFTVTTDKSFEEVWTKVIDLFATRGLTIKVIDKSSGLIVTEDYSFLSKYTVENENRTLKNPDAWVVCESYGTWTGGRLAPDKIMGAWNVRIKPEGKGTLININITNLVASIRLMGQFNTIQTVELNAKSTGNFEKSIADLIK